MNNTMSLPVKRKVFLLPYAGASVMAYSQWGRYVSENTELYFLEMPGRGTKTGQNLETRMPLLINSLYAELVQNVGQGEYALFGHSMGSLLAYELYYKIVAEGFRKPSHMFLSGRVPPNISIHMKKVSGFSDADFLKEVAAYGGLPREVEENKVLRDFFLPIIRADFKLIEGYTYVNRNELIDCDLTVFYGKQDYSTPIEDMMEWRNQAGKNFFCVEFSGGHFFCMKEANMPDLISYIERI